MRTNKPLGGVKTHEGGTACRISPIEELRRSVCACLLWEPTFYESGVKVADRIKALVAQCAPVAVAELAVEARSKLHMRHVPLLLARELVRHPKIGQHPKLAANTVAGVIQRADEIAEFVAMYWQDGRKPLSKQAKLGLAQAFGKFNEYSFAKYNRDGAVKLRDVMFMVHPKPVDAERVALYKLIAANELATPDTWEVALSGGADKKEAFTRLLNEKKLGQLALLRNLRNMVDAGVDIDLIRDRMNEGATGSRVLPFRYVAAARAVPRMEPILDAPMMASMAEMPRLPGKTLLLVDVSGSMDAPLSEKSDLSRMDAGCALAALLRGVCDDVRVLSFSNDLVEVPPRGGFALIDAVRQSQSHQGTYLRRALETAASLLLVDRTIVITDEQSHDGCGAPIGRGYLINVASFQRGVGYGQWTHVSGFSEAVVSFIMALENALPSGRE